MRASDKLIRRAKPPAENLTRQIKFISKAARRALKRRGLVGPKRGGKS